MSTTLHQEERTLDPADWTEVRSLAHQALDAVLDAQMNIRDQPAWQLVSESVEALLSTPAPHEGLGTKQVVEDMLHHVLPYPAGHGHPRFWGWVCGTGTPIGMLADMLAAGINASSGTFNDAPTRVENQVLSWMRDLFEFPEGSSGIITSGASVANMIGLAVARDTLTERNIPRSGLTGLTGTPVVYTSQQVHSSVDKAMQLLGIGRDNLRKVPVDDGFRIRLDALNAMIEEDRRANRVPLAIVGNAGTVNTGAIDDLEGLADIAEKEGMWFHVDGAIGALAVMSPQLRPLFKGMARADSLAFDFHKWLYVPYEAGCVLIRDGDRHRRSFSVAASYLEPPPRGLGAMVDSSNLRGPQLSRGFKALKIWAQIREFGLDRLGSLQRQNVDQAQYLAKRIEREPILELMAPVALNIVCFRYTPALVPADLWDGFNQELLMRIQESGVAVPSGTRIRGHFCLRAAITNHRSTTCDFDVFIDEVLRLGRVLETQPPAALHP